tara:strand:- start:2 stop:526 length:525 start_codon:yes stop_codon:yes gene_type:complete
MTSVKPFWQQKSLQEMTRTEWESLCDGCAKCCLHKFIDDQPIDNLPSESQSTLNSSEQLDTNETIYYSNIACSLLNDKSCQCSQYAKRTSLVPECVKLSADNLEYVAFMPPSCTYRRLYEGRDIPSWHPLLNKGKTSAMHKAGMSVRGKIVKEQEVDLDCFEDHIVSWPINDCD